MNRHLLLGILVLLLPAKMFGGEWEMTDPGAANPQNVFFTDSRHGVITATITTGFVFGGLEVKAIRWTADGGETWTGAEVDADLSGCTLSGLWLSNPRIGWIGGTLPPADPLPRRPVLLKTDDGGKIWKQQPLPDARMTDIHRLWFDEQGKYGWINPYAGNLLWRTCDGAKTWQAVDLGASMAHPGFHVFSPDHVILAGGEGVVRLTRDGGKSWEKVNNTMEGPNASLNAIHFAADGRHGWAIGAEGKRIEKDGHSQVVEPVVLHTADGGASWVRQSLPVTKPPLTDVWAVSPTEAWICSHWGYAQPRPVPPRLFHTTDGGTTWKDETPHMLSLRKLFFVDTEHGWAVGGYGGSSLEPARGVLIYR